jgi:uncharacterized repeat protein (TIGR03843 family)
VVSNVPAVGVLAEADALTLLRNGKIDIEGRLVDASNTTLRAVITLDGLEARCVYKPVRGERPLWDFPDGTLAGREVAAYLVGAATGWSPVPPTVLRDGPLGPGACQLWIDTVDETDASGDDADASREDSDASREDSADADEVDSAERLLGFVPLGHVPFGWHRIAQAEDEDGKPYVLAHADDIRLARLAAFDVVINNADRKGGHILLTPTGDLYGVDHGVSFHLENKLRTILWGWIGMPIEPETLEVLKRLRAELDGILGDSLYDHLMISEVAEIGVRLDRLIDARSYPEPSRDWPSVPWPPI